MHEVDFLPVGDEGASGDAIAMRFRVPSGAQAVVIIDAGFRDDGEALVEHVQEWYGTKNVDLAILAHPDGDHIGGMGVVIENLKSTAYAFTDSAIAEDITYHRQPRWAPLLPSAHR